MPMVDLFFVWDIILKEIDEKEIHDSDKGDRLAELYDSGTKLSDLTNGVNYVRVKSFDKWKNILIISMTTIDQSQYDILAIEKTGRLLAWADRKNANKYTESKIIIVVVRILRLIRPIVDSFFVRIFGRYTGKKSMIKTQRTC